MAHPAKFPEIVEPILGRQILRLGAADALALERHIIRLDGTGAVRELFI
jgi:hypothetical protein